MSEMLKLKEDRVIKIKKTVLNNRLILAAFFLPALIMTVAFATMGVFPFGNSQIAVVDFYHQYLPLIEELQYKLQHGESLFYTWNGAGGCNFWNIIAYQAASPLNLLIILFPEKYLVEALTFLLVVRTGLAGSFMFYFLKKTHERVDFATVGFSSLYSLCAYVIAYYWNIMWMDAVMLLPLCILGLVRLIDGGRPTLYTVILAIIVFSNYYIGILVCIFILTYYFAIYFRENRDGGFRHFLFTSARTASYSVMAIAMSAVMLLPTWISMKKASAMNSDFPDYAFFYDDPLDIFNQLLTLSKNCYMEGLPNIGCGMAVVICLVFYFINRNIKLRSKAVNAVYLTFIFFSLNVNVLDYVWHGMHYPNMLPYRFAFAVSFVLINMAYEAFINLDRIEIRSIWAVFAGILAYYLLAQKLMADAVDDMNVFFYFGITVLTLFTALFVVYRKKLIKTNAFRYVFVVIVAAELSCVAVTNINMIGSTDKYEYRESSDNIAKAVEAVDYEFCRVEMDESLTLNEPARFHYKGMSQFASSINSVTNGLYERIGLEADSGGNRCKYTMTNPVTNSMLGIKYIIAKNDELKDSDLTLIKKYGNTRLYENRYSLAMGYMLPESIHTWDCFSSNPFDNLNDYVRAATSNKYGDVFNEITPEAVKGIASKVRETGNGGYSVIAEDEADNAEVTFSFTSRKTGKYYVYVEADAAEQILVRKEGSKRDIEIDEDYGAVVNIGEVKKGDGFNLDIQYESGRSGTAGCHVCRLEEGKWSKAYGMISSNVMTVTDYGDTWLKGTVNTESTGVLVTSVPYDEGWTLKVDGKKREIMDPAGDVWIATPLDAGAHEIELKFRPPGITAGLIITILSVLLLVISHIHYTRVNELRRRESLLPKQEKPVDDIGDTF